MSGSLNIYPFQDPETTIRFGVQISLFLIGLAITNQLIIKPALRLENERKKRTIGNKNLAQNKIKMAQELENTYSEKIRNALDELRKTRETQIKNAKETAHSILVGAHEKSQAYMEQMKSNLLAEKQNANAQIHLHVNELVNEIYSKLGITTK